MRNIFAQKDVNKRNSIFCKFGLAGYDIVIKKFVTVKKYFDN